MAKAGQKYPLLVYQHVVNRWWTPMLAIGIVLFALAYDQFTDPVHRYNAARWQILAAVGVLAILTGILFLVIRQIAYIQPMPGYVKFVTPFLRFHISYKRFLKTSSSEMGRLFPPNKLSGWMREMIRPLAGKMALVIELRSYPLPAWVLRSFLSKFFFKDKTIHFVILVDDWMRFSSELDSFRAGGPRKPQYDDPRGKLYNSLLSRLPKK